MLYFALMEIKVWWIKLNNWNTNKYFIKILNKHQMQSIRIYNKN